MHSLYVRRQKMKDDKYFITKSGVKTGPLENWEVLDLYDRKEIFDDDRINTWEVESTIGAYKEKLDALRKEIETPTAVHMVKIRQDIKGLNQQIKKQKWAIRGIGLLLVICIFLGAKVTFSF